MKRSFCDKYSNEKIIKIFLLQKLKCAKYWIREREKTCFLACKNGQVVMVLFSYVIITRTFGGKNIY